MIDLKVADNAFWEAHVLPEYALAQKASIDAMDKDTVTGVREKAIDTPVSKDASTRAIEFKRIRTTHWTERDFQH